MKIDDSQKIGITENTDPCFHLDIFDHLYTGNIIVTKRLTDKFIEKLVDNKDKCILHLTVTGFGGTKVEPFVPTVETVSEKFKQLLDKGFPVEQTVLRIDPIIPTDKGLEKVQHVIDTFKNYNIKRVRFSVLDMYEHVKERFKDAGLPLPYETFHAPLSKRTEIYEQLKEYGRQYDFEVEACGEHGIESIPCLSQKDIDILKLTDKIQLIGTKNQRRTCSCPSNKTQLYHNAPEQCSHKCLYCYWKK